MASFPQQFGGYTLHELIARGGMAEVYRATMPGVGGFEKTLAIKKILPHLSENDEFIAMLVDEARIIVGLNHANIAQVYDLGCIDDTYYIAMEYVHSVDLAEMIKELKKAGQTMPLPHAVYIASCICAGLHVAHSKVDETGRAQHIVHRDVSPHNVLISFGGDVKIIDFGVAKARGKETHTKAGVIKGKLLYMAPEQAMAKEIDGRSDLFAVGIILYNMLTGHLPFDGENEFQIYNNILSREIPPPRAFNPEIPEELNQIVMMMLQRDPEKRYQDGYTCKLELDRVLHGIAPGYAIGRLSAWVEDNFSHVLQARRQRRENRSGQHPMPQTPSSPVNQTGGGAYAGQSGRFPQAPLVPSPASFQQTSGALPQQQVGPTGFPSANPSGGFPVANTGGFPEMSPSGQWPAANGFGTHGVGASTELPAFPTGPHQTFQTEVSEDQTGNFKAAGGSRIPLVPLIGSIVMVLFIAALVAFNALKEEPVEGVVEDVAVVVEPVEVPEEPLVDEPGQGEVESAESVGVAKVVEEVAQEVAGEVAELEMITVRIGSKPEGATLIVGGEEKGKTPLTFEIPRSGEAVFVELSLEGHEPDGFRLVPAEDTERSFVLAELAKEEPTPKVEPKKTTKKTTKKTNKTTKKTTKKSDDDLFTVPLLPSTKKTPKESDDDELMNPF